MGRGFIRVLRENPRTNCYGSCTAVPLVIMVENHWVHQMKVNLYSSLRRIVGQKTVEIPLSETATVRQLLEELKLRYPQAYNEFVDQNGHLYPHVHLFINGRDIPYLNGLDTTLADQDNIDIFPPGHF